MSHIDELKSAKKSLPADRRTTIYVNEAMYKKFQAICKHYKSSASETLNALMADYVEAELKQSLSRQPVLLQVVEEHEE